MKRVVLLALFLGAIALPQRAVAFCGFYVAGGDASLFNDATQVALVRDGTRTVLSMQNSYRGPAEAFAMVVPVPQVLDEANVKTLEKGVFDRLDRLTAPRLVEYWEENPCDGQSLLNPLMRREYQQDTMMMLTPTYAQESADFGVEIKSRFAVGEYDIVVLSAQNSSGLDGYLRAEQYNIPKGAEPYLRPYVQQGSYFFVAKVDPKRAAFDGEHAVLSPLRFEYHSEEFQLPIRLGMINSQGEQDLIVYTIGLEQRYEVANYPNAFIPTNIEVKEHVRDSFGDFYRALFAATSKKNPGAVITEHAWQYSAASKCDPCPEPPVPPSELLPLGLAKDGDPQGGMGAWTVTRMHARYAPDDIGEDLVFRKAVPMVGGRERHAPDGGLEPRTVGADVQMNQFQGRYMIRHRWMGPITCFLPKFGQWGGRPPRDRSSGSVFLGSPNTDGTPVLSDSIAEVDGWLDQGVEELAISGSTPAPFSGNWFTYIFGYSITMLVLGLGLFLMRKLRQRSTAGFVVATFILCTGCCCATFAGDLPIVVWGLGSIAILAEGIVIWRRDRSAAPTDEIS